MSAEFRVLALLTSNQFALGSRALTAVIGFFVAVLAYRGYRRNDAPKMRSLAVGIFLLTSGVFLAVVVATWLGAGTGPVLLVRGLVAVGGLAVVLYALVVQ